MRKSALVVIITMAFNMSFAQSSKYQSVIMYSFTKYVIWPEAYNQADFEILVLGDTPMLEELKAMAQAKKVNGTRTIKVTKINNPSEIKKCNILFVPASHSAQLTDIIAKVNNQSILIVTEEQGLGTKGSNINFITKDGKLAFEINQTTVNKQNLKISNELSRMAILI